MVAPTSFEAAPRRPWAPSLGHSPRHIHAGFTLVGLLVSLAIFAAVLLVGLPTYRQWIGDEQVMNQARTLAKSMQHARSEAIKRGHRVNLCKSANGQQCTETGDWNQGFLMHDDTGAKGEVDADDTVIRVEGPTTQTRIEANRPLSDYVSYTSFGHARMLSGALQMGTFQVCKPGFRAVEVVLVGSGRVRIARSPAICP